MSDPPRSQPPSTGPPGTAAGPADGPEKGFHPPSSATWSPSDILIGFGAGFGVLLLGQLLVGAVDSSALSSGHQRSGTLIALQTISVAAFVVGAIVGVQSVAGSKAAALGLLPAPRRRIGVWRFEVPATVVYFFAALGIYLLAASIFDAVAHPSQDDIADDLGYGATLIGDIAIVALIVLGAAISEEIFFRGFMFAGLRSAIPAVPAAVLSSAVWASLHLLNTSVVAATQLFVFGLVLCWLYGRTGSIRQTILLHALNNLIGVLFLIT